MIVRERSRPKMLRSLM